MRSKNLSRSWYIVALASGLLFGNIGCGGASPPATTGGNGSQGGPATVAPAVNPSAETPRTVLNEAAPDGNTPADPNPIQPTGTTNDPSAEPLQVAVKENPPNVSPIPKGAVQLNPPAAKAIASLAEYVPASTTVFVSMPDLKDTYTKYLATGMGRWIQSAEMKPFRDSLRPTSALGLANLPGILGFDENLLAGFPKPACLLAVPTKNDAATILLIQTDKNDPAIAACLAGAEKYHAASGGKKTPVQLQGSEMATLFVTPRPAPAAAEEHLYFYTKGFFGIGGDATAVQTLINQWPANAAASLAGDASFQTTQQATERECELMWFVRPLAALELFEGPPNATAAAGTTSKKDKKAERPWSLILKQEGFTKIKGMSGSIRLNTINADLDYTIAIDAPLPYVRGMRSIHWVPGPKLELPPWVPAGVAELAWINSDPLQQFDAYCNWFDQLVAEGDVGAGRDIFDSLKSDPKGPMIDIEKDLFGTLYPTMAVVVDAKGTPSKFNPEGRLSMTIAQSKEIEKARKTLAKYFKADVDKKIVTLEKVGEGEVWFVPPGKALMIDAGSNMPQITTAAIISNYVIFSNDSDWLKKILADKAPQPVSKDPILTAVLTQVMGEETKATSVRQVIRAEESWAGSYERLLAGDTKSEPSSSVRMLKFILTGDTSHKYANQYKLLPPFAFSRNFLSPSGGSSDSFRSGIFSRGFILKPTPAPKPMKG